MCLVQARLLKQDPVSFTDIQGQQPAGQWAITGHEAEAGAASGAKGVRYNDVSVQVAGDGTPGPLSLGVAGTELTNSGLCPATTAPSRPLHSSEPQHSAPEEHDWHVSGSHAPHLVGFVSPALARQASTGW